MKVKFFFCALWIDLHLYTPLCTTFGAPPPPPLNFFPGSTPVCPLQLLLPDCVCFSGFSPIAYASAAAPRLRPFHLLNRVLEGSIEPLREHSQSSRFSLFSMMVVRHYSPQNIPHLLHAYIHTHKHTVKVLMHST